MSRNLAVAYGDAKRFPRVSGDEPEMLWPSSPPEGFSPRERG